jgi:hypothetical protein
MKTPPMKAQIQQRKYFVLQIKCPSLMTDQTQTHTECNICVKSAGHEVSRKSLQRKLRYSEKVLYSPSKAPLVVDRLQPNLRHLKHMHGKCQVWSFMKVPSIHVGRQLKMHTCASSCACAHTGMGMGTCVMSVFDRTG